MKLLPKDKVYPIRHIGRPLAPEPVQQFVRPDNELPDEHSEKGTRTCRWVYLPSKHSPGRLCARRGHRYCSQHQRELNAMEQAGKNWDEILAMDRATIGEPRGKRRLFVIRKRRPG